MTKLIVFIFIFYIISQIIKSVKKKQAKIKRDIPNLQENDSPIQIDLDFLEEKIAKMVDKRPRLLMETQEKLKVLSLDNNYVDEESLDEEANANKEKTKPVETKEIPKPKPKMPDFITFTPKTIAQGIVMAEILKRPK